MMGRIFLSAIVLGCLLTGCKSHQETTDGQSNGNQTETKMKKKMPQGQLTYVTYNFQGMAMEMVSNVELSKVDGKTQISFEYWYEERKFDAPDSLLVKARDIIEEEEMYNYSSSYKPLFNGRILDGFHWNFDAKFEGGERISSHGRNESPKGEGLHRIHALLRDAAMQALKENGELKEN